MSILTCFFLALIIPYAASINFNFTYINQNNSQDIILSGGPLGLSVDSTTKSSKYQFVAVEFDTNSGNDWDPTDPVTNISIGDHVAVWEMGLDYAVDLSHELPEWVIFGFSASTGDWFQKNKVLSWTFNSSELKVDESNRKNDTLRKMGLTAGMLVLVTGLAILAYFLWRRKKNDGDEGEELVGEMPLITRLRKQVRLLEWVWELYGNGALLEVVDPNLGSKFEEQEIRRLMIVGLLVVSVLFARIRILLLFARFV
ncbi:hypothetical protein L1987_55185 [Smallanthus sonchifolius]|uniref:Uncharacterized protein n=1 Tax=Smallanthus sonchifolius TaxID=185202 RepID=A0ACB9E9V5_9ASTR|nr:hypothetical protein L1987_55185 [Smallanthus sonchifolius]